MGITGVNFGVAETGTVVVVSNEGNGRLSAAMPPVHIALMGIERVVPKLDDLGVLLPLLVRSATGQRMSSYVSLIQGPRRAGEEDGPEEMHLVLVDNGRSAICATRGTRARFAASAAAPARTSARCIARWAVARTAGCTAGRSARC